MRDRWRGPSDPRARNANPLSIWKPRAWFLIWVLNLAWDSRRDAGAPLAAGEAAAQAVWHAVQAPHVALVRGAARVEDVVVPAAHAWAADAEVLAGPQELWVRAQAGLSAW